MGELRRFDPAEMKVLVVSDNAFERRIVMDLLIALGVKSIFTAEDGIAAFAQMMLKKPDMVIADAEMSPFTGFMLVREIRTAPIALRAVPIVLFTAETSTDFAEIARAAGANEVLSKPVSAHALRLTLEEAMLRPRKFVISPSYRGPERRSGDTTGALRRRANDEAKPGALDRARRALILAAIDEARLSAGRWADAGDPALLETTRHAIYAASEQAAEAGGDSALLQALSGALRLTNAAMAGQADARLLDVSLSAARAVLSAPMGRSAMRQALAEAVFDAAETRGTAGE